ncbi:MAG: aminotransferase class V-fold PLP-dependent enzyme, partial [Solirubrobacteraceae bacterium]
MTEPAIVPSFREGFPVVERLAYFNAGTEGPVPQAAEDAVRARVHLDLTEGRVGRAYFDDVMELAELARAGYATAIGADPSEVALTSSTTYGINTVLAGLSFSAGDEIVTSDQEHPGVLVPLRRAQAVHGVEVRMVPFAELPGEVSSDTRLVVCSHVSWVGGEVMDVTALRATGVPVLLDAAQALGAIPVDVHELGVEYYAGSGQKWMCGPEGSGVLYVRPDCLDELEPPFPGYMTVADHDAPLHSALAGNASRLDDGWPSAVRSTWALASMGVLSGAGWAWVHERAATGAERLAELLRERHELAPRGRSTLVSWKAQDADGDVARLLGAGIIVR